MDTSEVRNEARMPRNPVPSAMLAGASCEKEAVAPDISRIEYNSPENAVVLSHKLEQLIGRVGGCQTEEVRALVRRIMFEVISQRKY